MSNKLHQHPTYTAVACMQLDGTTALINDDEKMQCIDFVLP
jgi:hypothetical protein